MKVLRVIGIIILALILLAVVKAFMKPAEFDVSRTAEIDAPAKAIWPHITDLKAADAWNAWLQIDDKTVKNYSDEQGEVGSWASWESEHPDVGNGKQTLTKLEPYTLVESRLDLPWGSPPTGYYHLEESEGKTKVTYGFRGVNDTFFARLMGGFFDMESMVGPMFETGLANMKEIVEAERSTTGKAEEKKYSGYTISKMTKPEMVLIGKRDQIAQKDLAIFYSRIFGLADAKVNAMQFNKAGMPSGVFFEWNEEEKTTDVYAGIPIVANNELEVDGLETLTIPESKAYFIDYYGDYSGSEQAHYAMSDMLKENGLGEADHIIEEYMNDPTGLEPREWHTRVYYLFSS